MVTPLKLNEYIKDMKAGKGGHLFCFAVSHIRRNCCSIFCILMKFHSVSKLNIFSPNISLVPKMEVRNTYKNCMDTAYVRENPPAK